MGAGVSTEGAPLTRVKCKNNLGVLFDPEAEKKFYATATGPEGEAVPWPRPTHTSRRATSAGATRSTSCSRT